MFYWGVLTMICAMVSFDMFERHTRGSAMDRRGWDGRKFYLLGAVLVSAVATAPLAHAMALAVRLR